VAVATEILDIDAPNSMQEGELLRTVNVLAKNVDTLNGDVYVLLYGDPYTEGQMFAIASGYLFLPSGYQGWLTLDIPTEYQSMPGRDYHLRAENNEGTSSVSHTISLATAPSEEFTLEVDPQSGGVGEMFWFTGDTKMLEPGVDARGIWVELQLLDGTSLAGTYVDDYYTYAIDYYPDTAGEFTIRAMLAAGAGYYSNTVTITVTEEEIGTNLTISVPSKADVGEEFMIQGNLTETLNDGPLTNMDVNIYVNDNLLTTLQTAGDGGYSMYHSINTVGSYTIKAEFPGVQGYKASTAKTGIGVGGVPPPVDWAGILYFIGPPFIGITLLTQGLKSYWRIT